MILFNSFDIPPERDTYAMLKIKRPTKLNDSFTHWEPQKEKAEYMTRSHSFLVATKSFKSAILVRNTWMFCHLMVKYNNSYRNTTGASSFRFMNNDTRVSDICGFTKEKEKSQSNYAISETTTTSKNFLVLPARSEEFWRQNVIQHATCISNFETTRFYSTNLFQG